MNRVDLWEQEQIRKAEDAAGPPPEKCPVCGGELLHSKGYVGELVLYCPEHGLAWEDSGDAIRRVI